MDFNESEKSLDFLRGFTMEFDMITGSSSRLATCGRRLSDMKHMFSDERAEAERIASENPLIYEFHSLPAPEHAGDLAFGCSIVYPGKVGDEYFMTKGHFHTIHETGEVYFCLSGHGYMLIENLEGDWSALELTKGRVAYVPKGYAHRSICVGRDEPLVTFFTFRADAGHDYGAIETKGFRKLLVERDGKPAIIDNHRWK
jgi:glucose-6-phosphate isomerase, archaeal